MSWWFVHVSCVKQKWICVICMQFYHLTWKKEVRIYDESHIDRFSSDSQSRESFVIYNVLLTLIITHLYSCACCYLWKAFGLIISVSRKPALVVAVNVRVWFGCFQLIWNLFVYIVTATSSLISSPKMSGNCNRTASATLACGYGDANLLSFRSIFHPFSPLRLYFID